MFALYYMPICAYNIVLVYCAPVHASTNTSIRPDTNVSTAYTIQVCT